MARNAQENQALATISYDDLLWRYVLRTLNLLRHLIFISAYEYFPGSVSHGAMVTPMALIYKVLFSSLSTFEAPPFPQCSASQPLRDAL